MEHDFDSSNLTFSLATAEQLVLLQTWLKQPHITKYWGDGGMTLPDYQKFVAGKPSLFHHYFAYYKGVPIAFLMSSHITEKDDWAPWKAPDGVTLSLDMMMGDTPYLGRGISHLILQDFISIHCQDAAAILVDPETTNIKGIATYRKAGFVPVGIYTPKSGAWQGIKHQMMRKDLIG